ncbi:uncharacterized protein CLUP02_16930 [Colletotrichum lupini]|uniref:Uncharacterized protein n=1 Tax=Colletotrichum lupini TaxID=145971 RepID=A0A9Q8T9C4_9PEZI|nr:uncharacterized protein CLUP02_16930 [Colletotrichum lupini]UQC91395.1 hypothetical protein CLUP02_16930 [Colletotrichum lupini]
MRSFALSAHHRSAITPRIDLKGAGPNGGRAEGRAGTGPRVEGLDREDVQRKRSWGVQPQCEGVLLPASDLGIAPGEASCPISLSSNEVQKSTTSVDETPKARAFPAHAHPRPPLLLEHVQIYLPDRDSNHNVGYSIVPFLLNFF